MSKSMFTFQGNICGDRIRMARAIQNPPMTQDDLATKIQLAGLEMTQRIISKIEKNQRHVCDAELLEISRALGVSLDWLCGITDEIKLSDMARKPE